MLDIKFITWTCCDHLRDPEGLLINDQNHEKTKLNIGHMIKSNEIIFYKLLLFKGDILLIYNHESKRILKESFISILPHPDSRNISPTLTRKYILRQNVSLRLA